MYGEAGFPIHPLRAPHPSQVKLANMVIIKRMDSVVERLSSSSGKLAVVSALAAISTVVAYYFLSPKKVSNDSDLLPALTEEETREIMAKILEKVKISATSMIRAAEGIKQKIQSQGQDIEDRQLFQTFILPHFETSLKQLQDSVLVDFDVDLADLEDAVNTYVHKGDKKLGEIVERIRMIYKELGGELDEEDDEAEGLAKPASHQKLPLDMILELLEAITQEMSARSEDFIETYKKQHGLPDSRAKLEHFQNQLMALSEGVEMDVCESLQVSQVAFQKSLQAHVGDPGVQELIRSMQSDNIMLMARHGIDFASMMP